MPRDEHSWVQTFSGRQFFPLDPRADEIDIIDIAHALSNCCRYAGHCRVFFSVAQHSVLLSRIVSPQAALWGLLHDASEAYLGDMCRPIKRAMTEYRLAENNLMMAVSLRFGLPWPKPDEIAHADLIMLATERRDLMATPPIPWVSTENVQLMRDRICPEEPFMAAVRFLRRYCELTHEPSLVLKYSDMVTR